MHPALLFVFSLHTAEPQPMPPPPPKPAEPLEQEHKADGACAQKSSSGPSFAAITGTIGGAAGTASALTALVAGVVAPAPWDYGTFAAKLQRDQIEFRKSPNKALLLDADKQRAGLTKIETAFSSETGLFISSGVALLSSGAGLAAGIAALVSE